MVFCFLILGFINYSWAQTPKRIVSLAPALTQEIFLLGCGDRIVGNTPYCTIPEAAKHIEKVSTGVVEVNIEKILRLNPDLVIAAPHTSPKAIASLKNLGLSVKVYPFPHSYEGICQEFTELGKILGKQEKADSIISASKARLKKIQARKPQSSHPLVFMEIGSKPLFTAIQNTFLDDFITLLGGTNIAHNATSGIFSREEVIRRNPDIIIIVSMGVAGKEEKQYWEKFPNLKAAKNHNILIIESSTICSPTPISFIDALEIVNKQIHH